jgi:hypothetical protein
VALFGGNVVCCLGQKEIKDLLHLYFAHQGSLTDEQNICEINHLFALVPYSTLSHF